MENLTNYFCIINDTVRDNCIRAIQSLPEGYEVVIRKKDKKRTNQQNKYYWGMVLDTFSKETGFTPEELHNQFAAKFLGVDYTTVTGEDGEEIQLAIPRSTTKQNTEEFNFYIDKITAAAMVLGFTIAPPKQHGIE